eukprot:5635099-Pyramimonas_sp.AAC.1
MRGGQVLGHQLEHANIHLIGMQEIRMPRGATKMRGSHLQRGRQLNSGCSRCVNVDPPCAATTESGAPRAPTTP